jgi:hypothetical protein
MRLAILVLFLTVVSAVVYGRDLTVIARRERARREALENGKKRAELGAFDDSDLERYRRRRKAGRENARVAATPTTRPRKERDLAKEKAFWGRELVKHERELARIDASIRRLEMRIREREAKRRPGERLSHDPASRLLEDSLESLREERRRIEDRFRERARKAGAFPGWIRPLGPAR